LETIDRDFYQKAHESVVAMMLGIKSTSPFLNLQLMYKDGNIPKAISNLASRVLVDFWGTSIDSEFTLAIDKIFKGSQGEFPPTIKGCAVEQYFIYCLKKQGSIVNFKLTLYTIDFNAKNNWKGWTTTNINVSNVKLRFFDGIYPITDSNDWNSSTIFIPTSNSYPNIDLLLWDHNNQIFYPIQITVANPISSHDSSVEDFLNKPFQGQKQKKLQGWNTRSTKFVDDKGTNTKFVWIGGNVDVSKKMNGSYFSLIQELDQDSFPLMKNLRL